MKAPQVLSFFLSPMFSNPCYLFFFYALAIDLCMDSICCAERLEDYLHKKNGHYAMLCCVVLCCVPSASVATIFDLFPILFPFLSPCEGFFTNQAYFLREMLLLYTSHFSATNLLIIPLNTNQ